MGKSNYKQKESHRMVEAGSNAAVIIDNGSGMVKAGFSGEEAPSGVFPSVVGVPLNKSALLGVSQKDHYIGEEAIAKKGVLSVRYPIAHGKVEDWSDMEKVWHHCFYSVLRVEPKEVQGCLLTEAPLQPKENREKMAEIMFETFQVKNLYVAIQAVMSLYSAGRTTGLVVDSGDGVSHTVPVFQGYSIPHAIFRIDIAGRVLNDYLQYLVQEHMGRAMTSASEMDSIRDIKEKLCYVCATQEEYDEQSQSALSSSSLDENYTLPDKEVLVVKGFVRITAPELLFQPALQGKSCESMHGIAYKSINESDMDVRKELAKNMILSGGTTMFEGLETRLKNEVTAKLPAGSDVRTVADPGRKYSVWRGASTLTSLSSFAAQWVSASEYEELGHAIVHRKCS